MATHGLRLKYPKLFGVKISKTAVVPAELLRVLSGQVFRGKLEPKAVSIDLNFTNLDQKTA